MTNNDWAVTGLLQRNEVSWTWSTLAVMKAWGSIVLWLQRICKRHAVVKLHHVKQAAPWHSMVGQGCFDWSIVWMPRAEWTRRKNRGFMHNKQSEMRMPLITWRGAHRLAQSADNDHEETTWKVRGRMLMLPDCTIIDIPTRRARVVCWVKRNCSCPKTKKLNNVITKEKSQTRMVNGVCHEYGRNNCHVWNVERNELAWMCLANHSELRKTKLIGFET